MITLKDIHTLIDVPIACLLLAMGVLLSCMTKFPQLRKIKTFFKIISSKQAHESNQKTITPLQALFTAMSTSLGMGTIVAPPLAVAIGGPGALFWLMIYSFFGSVTKFVEVTFAIKFKRYASDGTIIGGPTGYLYQVHPYLADWYGFCTVLLFSSWSGLQAKSMAAIYTHQGVPEYLTGIIMSIFVTFMLFGGAKRIGDFSSKLVPSMCILYLLTASFILFADLTLLSNAITSIFTHAFTPSAAIAGFAGSTLLTSMREGIFKSAFITEAGIGTAAIPHALANTDRATDQGILAMYSMFADTFFCMISGLITLITGVWQLGIYTNDLPLIAFKQALPMVGSIALTTTMTLFIIGTAIGNSLNGSQSFSFFTNHRWMNAYSIFVGICIFLGAVLKAPTLWDIADLILPMVALPNMIGLIILTIKHRKELIV